MPQISIIVPVYKVEQYLPKCLDSILAQTFTDWECILIDDGSPDNSGKICDEYAGKDNRFRVIHQENAGSAGARNTGLNVAQGRYIICVDSDDWVEPDYLEQLYNKAEDTGADVVGCNLVREYGNKSVEVKNQLPPEPLECLRGLLEGWIQGWLHVKLIRRSILVEKNINWVEGLDMWEDMLLSAKVFAYARKIASVDKVLYHYRCNPDSIVSNITKERLEQIIGNVQEIELFLKERNLLPVFQDSIATLKTRVKASYVIFSKNKEIRKNNRNLYKEFDSKLFKLPCSPFGKIHISCYLHGFMGICDFLIFLRNKK